MIRHFVLVHGACHGAWCWYKVIAELKEAGHKVTALDLAACGIDPRQLEDVHSSVVEYSEPLLTFMASLPPPAGGDDDEKVILVGHSMAGFTLCMAMERFPEKVAVAVFVAAGMLGPDLTFQIVDKKYAELSPTADIMDSEVIYGNGPNKPATGVLFGPKYLETHSYRCSPRTDLELGTTLVRPCPASWDGEEVAKDTALTKDKYGTVARAYVVCDEEQDGAFQWWLIENNPPDEYTAIPGSDHMVMFSQPRLLSQYLLQLGSKYF